MPDSTLPHAVRNTQTKPEKPHSEFPLFAHASGRWAKKVRGKLWYFGPWSDDRDGKAALARWLEQRADLLAGRKPRKRRPSSARARVGKPNKPHPDFPLFPHASGRWAKKVRGTFKYFGKIESDPEGKVALETWLDQRDDLLAGRTPRAAGDGLTVADLCNRYLTTKKHQVSTREITRRHFEDLYTACALAVGQFGKNRLVDDLAADDFEVLRVVLAKTRGAWALGGVVQKIRSVFKYGYEAELIDKPVRFGPQFKRPGKSAIRREKADKGEKMFESGELRAIIKAASQPLKAMILLAINCGLGNSDCGQLRFRNLDLQKGWINYPRPKTGIARRCPLWKKTVAAIKAAIKERPTDYDETTRAFVFLTKNRQPWTKDRQSNPVSAEFRKLLVKLTMHRIGRGFYTARHVLETIGGDTRDQVAVNVIMGHCDEHSSATYRERVDDVRLKAVTDHVHKWLYPPKRKAK